MTSPNHGPALTAGGAGLLVLVVGLALVVWASTTPARPPIQADRGPVVEKAPATHQPAVEPRPAPPRDPMHGTRVAFVTNPLVAARTAAQHVFEAILGEWVSSAPVGEMPH